MPWSRRYTMNHKLLNIAKFLSAEGNAHKDRYGMIKPTLFLSLCVLIAVLLGLYRIGYYSIWLDENTTLTVTKDWKILKVFLTTVPEQQPLYYFLIKWLNVNHTLFGIRLFSLVCDALAIIPLYLIGKRVFSSVTAQTACIFYAFSPFMLYYSQEGRMYTLFVLLTLIQATFLIKWILDGNGWAKYGFTIFSILSMYTHFFASFLLACEFIWMLAMWVKNVQIKIRSTEAIIIFAVVGIAYMPQFVHIFSNLGGMSQAWRELYNIAFAIPYTFFRFGAGYGIFPLNYQVKLDLMAYLPTALVWAAAFGLAYLPASILVAKRIRQVTSVQFLVFVIAFFPIIMVVAASLFKNVASERYVVYSAPFFYLATASAQESGTQAKRLLKIAALVLPILLAFIGIGFHYFNPDFVKTNYKAAAAYILEQDFETDRVVCSPDIVAGLMQYYLKNKMNVTPYRSWEVSESDSHVWLVERLAKKIQPLRLAGKGFEKISEIVFPQENGVRVAHWRKLHLKQ